MNTRQFFDITEGFDNIQYVDTPMFMHFWFEDDKINSKPGTALGKKFAGDTRIGLLDYLEKEHAKGNTVYFYGEPHVMYNPHDFTPSVMFRTNSYEGVLKTKKEETETIIENNITNYKYLLIA